MSGLAVRGVPGSTESNEGRFSELMVDEAKADVVDPPGARVGSASSHG